LLDIAWHSRQPIRQRRQHQQQLLPVHRNAGTILIYVLLAGATILGLLVVYFAMGRRAVEILGCWRTWLADNNGTVMSVLLRVFAVVLVGQGISGLSG
jgi:hypothetical protein